MTQPPAPRQRGIPVWVWILVVILVIVALWWILATDRPTGGVGEEPVDRSPELTAPPPAATPSATPPRLDTGTALDGEPIEEPAPPPP